MPEILGPGGLQDATPDATSARKRPTNEDFVTILTTKGPLATKMLLWHPRPTARDNSAGEWKIISYDNAKTFTISERIVRNIHDLAAELNERVQDPRSLVVHGKPAEGIDREHAYRRLHPRKRADGTVERATLCPAARHWVPLDMDSIPC